MATIKYSCNVCKRKIDILENPENITVFSKCIITNGCRGKLNKLSKNQNNYRETLPKLEHGLNDYVQRKIFYEHKQNLAKNIWKITHNLGVLPVVEVYVNDGNTNLKFENYQIEILDNNTILIKFLNNYSGIAQCIARSSVINIKDTHKDIQELFQVTYNGIFVLAIPRFITTFSGPSYLPQPTLPVDTKNPPKPIRLEISLIRPNREEVICVETIPQELITTTPWVSWNEILVRKRRNYSIKTKSFFTFTRTFQEDIITKNMVENGTQIRFLKVDFGTGYLQPIESDDVLFLLANSPYSAIDKIRNKVVDVSKVNFSDFDYFVYENGEIYTDKSNLENTYPDIQKVN